MKKNLLICIIFNLMILNSFAGPDGEQGKTPAISDTTGEKSEKTTNSEANEAVRKRIADNIVQNIAEKEKKREEKRMESKKNYTQVITNYLSDKKKKKAFQSVMEEEIAKYNKSPEVLEGRKSPVTLTPEDMEPLVRQRMKQAIYECDWNTHSPYIPLQLKNDIISLRQFIEKIPRDVRTEVNKEID